MENVLLYLYNRLDPTSLRGMSWDKVVYMPIFL